MPTPKASLISTHQLLHLTHHRNKNQHRLSKWYSSFSILRRQVSNLITELSSLETAQTYSSKGGGGENKYVLAAREKVEARVKFLRAWVLGDCYLAFSNLVADNQYSAVGLVLLGCLARVRSILKQLVDDEEEEVNFEVIEEMAGQQVDAHGDDLGEVVERKGIVPGFEDWWRDVDEGGDDELDEPKEGRRQKEGRGQEEQKSGGGSQKPAMARSGKKKRVAPEIDKDIAEEESDDQPDAEVQKREKRKQNASEEGSSLTMESLLELERIAPGPRIDNHNRPPKAVMGQGPRKKRKKGKGKGDTFDDLFSSLI